MSGGVDLSAGAKILPNWSAPETLVPPYTSADDPLHIADAGGSFGSQPKTDTNPEGERASIPVTSMGQMARRHGRN